MTTKESYQEELDRRIQQKTIEIEELKTRLEITNDVQENAIEKQMDILHGRLEVIKDKARALKRAENESWGSIKTSVENAWSNLEKAMFSMEVLLR